MTALRFGAARSIAMILLVVLASSAVGCSGDDNGDPASSSSTSVSDAAGFERPVVGPVELEAADQESDGASVVVTSVTLPSPGYLVVHADAGNMPGQVLGHSELLPEGTSTEVVVPLDAPLASSALVWPMAHLDLNDNGVYEFAPPGDVTDGPAQFADGRAATLPIAVTVTPAD